MKRFCLTIICMSAVCCGLPQDDGPALEGLSGRSLADALREIHAPAPVQDDSWAAPAWMTPAEVTVALVPDEWWREGTPPDLYNLAGAPAAFAVARYDYPPAPLSSTEGSGNGWETGIGLGTNAWQPTADRRGDLARRMMYMALMYPQELWGGRAVTVYEDGQWPLLTKAGAKAYIDWHRADPVDDREREECAAVKAVQGNDNPFVSLPELAEYLWGDKAGMGYVPPTPEATRTPLRGHYSRSADTAIDLYSPHVPDDAVWRMDGTAVKGNSIELDGMASGSHILSFDAGNIKGKLTVIIEP